MSRNFKILLKYSMVDKLKAKSFKVFIILMTLLMAALIFGPRIFNNLVGDSDEEQAVTIGVISSEEGFNKFLDSTKSSQTFAYYSYERTDKTDNFDKKFVYVIDIDNKILYSKKNVTNAVERENLSYLIDKSKLENNLGDKIGVTQIVVQEIKSEKKVSEVMLFANVIVSALFYFIILLGTQMLGQEILEEKSSKSIEIILTSVNSTVHMLVRILSNLLYVFTIFLFAIFAFLALTAIDIIVLNNDGGFVNLITDAIANTENLGTIILLVASVTLIFLVAVATISILMAVSASTYNSINDMQSAYSIVTLTTLASFYASLFIQDMQILSKLIYVPIANFFILPKVIMIEGVSSINLILASLSSLLFCAILAYFGTKIYRDSILNNSEKGLVSAVKRLIKNRTR